MSHALAPYFSPDEREAELDRLARNAGAIVIEYGRSRDGRPLRAARVPASTSRSTSPRVLCSANIHGVELIGGRVALGLLEALAEPFPALRDLRERAEVWIVPCLNPDGYARTFERGGRGRVRDLRPNAAGVDLNRNFPLPFGARPSMLSVAGSSNPSSTFYRGQAPFSEPETRSLNELLERWAFRASINLHSFMGTFIPARVIDVADFEGYRKLCDAFKNAQPTRKYRRVASRRFDRFTGEQEDHQHHVHRTWAVCTEVFPIVDSLRQHLIAPSTFWRFNPRDPRPWIENDVPGITSFFLAALDMERPGFARPELAPRSG